MIKALKNNEDLALLVDQRDSSGPIINFFGKQAYATDGFAYLALKYQTMICPFIQLDKKMGILNSYMKNLFIIKITRIYQHIT